MKSARILIIALLLLSLMTASVIAKNGTIGIYAIIDKVVFEPDGPSPKFVRISGVFVVPVPMSSGNYASPRRGELYFRIPPGMEQATRKDWNELKTLAGTGHTVGFAYYWVPDPTDPHGNPHHSLEVRVLTNKDDVSPENYPLPNPKGIIRVGDEHDPDFAKIAAQLEQAARR